MQNSQNFQIKNQKLQKLKLEKSLHIGNIGMSWEVPFLTEPTVFKHPVAVTGNFQSVKFFSRNSAYLKILEASRVECRCGLRVRVWQRKENWMIRV